MITVDTIPHTLQVTVLNHDEDNDRVRLFLGCPDCDRKIRITIEPAEGAEGLVAALVAAHQQQAVSP